MISSDIPRFSAAKVCFYVLILDLKIVLTINETKTLYIAFVCLLQLLKSLPSIHVSTFDPSRPSSDCSMVQPLNIRIILMCRLLDY